MRGAKGLMVIMALAMVAIVAMSVELKRSLRAGVSRAALLELAKAGGASKAKRKFRTLGDFMAANYGWKPQAAASASRSSPPPKSDEA